MVRSPSRPATGLYVFRWFTPRLDKDCWGKSGRSRRCAKGVHVLLVRKPRRRRPAVHRIRACEGKKRRGAGRLIVVALSLSVPSRFPVHSGVLKGRAYFPIFVTFWFRFSFFLASFVSLGDGSPAPVARGPDPAKGAHSRGRLRVYCRGGEGLEEGRVRQEARCRRAILLKRPR